ncbi:MAG: 5-formyltetrahydrofolate cyclo-ligase [Bosea sp. (in: a-proteobacteria)]
MTQSSPIAAEKALIRADALARRDGLDLDARLEADEAIAAHVLALDVWDKLHGPVAGYWPMRSEADPRPIMTGLAGRGLSLCLPAVVDGALQFRAWAMWGPLVPGGFGTLVPPVDAAIVTPAALLVPLAAFDKRGFRLGYGKGYYDRALSCLPGVRSIGIAYAAQEVSHVPSEPHDMTLGIVVTEQGVRQFPA